MAKLSGLIVAGRVGTADQKVVDAMPDAPVSVVEQPKKTSIKISSHTPAVEVGVPEVDIATPSVSSPAVSKQVDLDSKSGQTELSVELIRPSKYQVRSVADPDYIDSLCESIQTSGVISPIVVRPVEGVFEIIAGHHRYEACRRLGHSVVPVQIRQMTDADAAKALASDNFVRRDLSDYERYKHSKMLTDNGFCKTGREVASVLGVSPAKVTQINSFEKFPVGAKAVLEIHPEIIGADAAYSIKDLALKEPDLFTEAVVQVSEGKLQQSKIESWMNSRLSSGKLRVSCGYRSEVKIERPGLGRPIKLTFTDGEAKIQADGLNPEKLKKLIEENLNSLLR